MRGGALSKSIAAVLGLGLLAPAAASADTVSFNYNGTDGTDGTAQTWPVPAGITGATCDLYGAEGGAGCTPCSLHAAGGLGGHVRATLAVTPGQVFQITVGGFVPGPGD